MTASAATAPIPQPTAGGDSHRAWDMLVRAFLCQNVAIGCAFGSFGVSVLALQSRYATGRAEASMGLALVLLMMGLLGPFVARLITRRGLRLTMACGVALSAAGYAVVAVAPSMTVVLAAYGLLIGPGVTMFGSLPCSMLAGGWFPETRGRAVGLSNMPLLVALLPLASLAMIDRFGLPALYFALSALHLLLVPVVFGIVDPPLTPLAADEPTHGEAAPAPALLRRPLFWLMVLGGGLLNATGITGVSHMVAVTVEKGIEPGFATLLLSVMGGASVVGSGAIGFVCDRLGGARALALLGLGFASGWAVVLATGWLPVMVPAMLVIGACGAGVFPTINVLGAQLFGAAALPRLIGLFGLFTLPLTFLLPPAAGALRDATGSYRLDIFVIVAACGFVALAFFAVSRVEARRTRQAAAFA